MCVFVLRKRGAASEVVFEGRIPVPVDATVAKQTQHNNTGVATEFGCWAGRRDGSDSESGKLLSDMSRSESSRKENSTTS